MKIKEIPVVFLFLLLSTCFPYKQVNRVTGQQAIQSIAGNIPILARANSMKPAQPMKQTIGDFTVSIEQFYIGQNIIAFGLYAQDSSGKRYFPPVKSSLEYSNGASLDFFLGTGLNGSSDSLGIRLPPGEQADIIIFKDKNNADIQLPFDGVLTLTYRESNLWHQLTGMAKSLSIGPIQFKISIPNP